MKEFIEFIKEFNIQTILTMIVVLWYMLRHFERKFEKRCDIQDKKIFLALQSQDEKIFQLATGKTLKEAMLEAKCKNDEKGI